MTRTTKMLTGAAAAALATLTLATPAQAQYNPYDPYGRNGVDVADIARGVAVAGAAAAAVGAIANAARGAVYGGGYGYPTYPNGGGYGYPNSGYPAPGGYGYPAGNYGYGAYGTNNLQRYAIDSCARRASQYGQVQVTQVRPRSNTSLRVEGVAGTAYNAGWGYARPERRAFQCDVRSDGRITYFDTDRIRY